MTTERNASGGAVQADDDEVSMVAIATFLLRWRWTIVVFGVLGGFAGLGYGLTRPRLYQSSATFIPQGPEAASSGVALAASQFGIRLPSATGSVWGPSMYMQLLSSRSVLERIAVDTESVLVDGSTPTTLMNVLEIDAPSDAARNEAAVRALNDMIVAGEIKAIQGVTVTVSSRWPTVSLALAQRLVRELNRFNVETRKSQASAERQFTEGQAAKAQRELREAEDSLQSHMRRNRAINSPELTLERDRLNRVVATRQQVYTTLVTMLEEAKIREVRDTPVITVLEPPRQALRSVPRRSLRKGVLGGIAGGIVGILVALLRHLIVEGRRTPDSEAQQLLRLLEAAVPGFLRRRRA